MADLGEYEVCLFGQPSSSADGTRTPVRGEGQRQILAALAISRKAGQTTSQLVQEVYPDELPRQPESAVRQMLYRLRKSVPDIRQIGNVHVLDLEPNQVDLWHFDQLATSDSVDSAASALQLWIGTPFEDAHLSLAVHSERERLRALKLRALKLLASKIDATANSEHIELVLDGLVAEPHQEDVTAEAAKMLFRVGRQADALVVLRRCRQRFLEDLGLDTSSLLNDVELALLEHDNHTLGLPIQAPPPIERVQLQEAGQSRIVGRDAPTQQLLAVAASALSGPGRLTLIEGPAGIGKTTLATHFAKLCEEGGIQVRIGFTTEGGRTALESILEALPELTQRFSDDRNAVVAQTDFSQLSIARIVERELLAISQQRPTLLLLEDLHDSDLHTANLIRFLSSIALPTGLIILLTARPADNNNAAWTESRSVMQKRAQFEKSMISMIDLPPLELDDLIHLVQIDHPDHDPMMQIRFATELHRSSGGNPLYASMLSKAGNPGFDGTTAEDITSDEFISLYALYGPRRVDDDVLSTLATAALIGLDFDVADLTPLVEASETLVLNHIEQGIHAGLCVETNHHDRFRFVHSLTQAALATRVTKSRRRRVFATLATDKNRTSREIVRYVEQAEHLLSAESAIALLRDSGRQLQAENAFVEAARAFERTLELLQRDDAPDQIDLLIDLTACLTRAGALEAARSYRHQAFSLASQNHDLEAMARAALAGLPSGQASGGDEARLQMFLDIDPAGLPRELHIELRRAIAAETRILGDYEKAIELLHVGGPADDIVLETEMLLLTSDGPNPVPVHHKFSEIAADLPLGELRARIRLRELRSGLQEQVPHSPTELFDEVEIEIRAHGTPRSVWGLQMLDSSLNDVGARDTGATSARALETGLSLGIPDAFDGWAVNLFVRHWLDESLDEALRIIDASGPSMRKNVAWHAAISLAAAATGETERAQQQADLVIDELQNGKNGHWAAPAAAALAEASAIGKWPEAAKACAEILSERRGWAVIVGLGVAHLGPADRYLGLTASVLGDEDPAPLFRAAIEQAASAQTPLWASRAKADIDLYCKGTS